ncbi:MAG: hypothetical protein NQ127_00590 [Candidatus Cardinium sp.]|nr:hypothetical protein [Candidatus Cardinium sp.]
MSRMCTWHNSMLGILQKIPLILHNAQQPFLCAPIVYTFTLLGKYYNLCNALLMQLLE